MTRSLFFLFILLVLSLIFSQLFFYQLGGHETATLFEHVISTNHLLAEFLFVAGLVALLVNGGLLYRLAGYSIFIAFMIICSLQYASRLLTGEFLTPTAIDNIQHVGLILSPSKIVIAGVLCLLLLVIVVAAEHYFKRAAGWKQTILLFAGCSVLAAFQGLDARWLSDDTLSKRAKLYYSNVNLGSYISPIQAFAGSLGRLSQIRQVKKPLTRAELQTLAEFGISYNPQSDYPLIKDYIYQSDLPFGQQSNPADSKTRLNIIVFLSEGLSARVIQPYNDQYPGLTPHIAGFAHSAMRVDNYYNHTFATYRGLLGQLCSIFPVYAGGQINDGTDYYCLADLFKEELYETYFLFSQQKAETRLDEVLAKTNIEHILDQEDLRYQYLDGEAPKRPLALSDQQLMRATIAHLKTLEQRQKSGDATPFFMGFYNIETHAYYQPSDDGLTYEGHDSYILDSIHNYDDAFGKFWAYFKQSDLFSNTVVIFTTDHTHFQGRDFVGLVNNQADYKPYFVDKIPLLIYHPVLTLPAEFDANFASSIDLAPTIAHLMRLENRSNSFVGRSIFERLTNESLAFGEGHVFLIGPDGIKIQNQYFTDPKKDGKLNLMFKAMSNMHALETQGRIWNHKPEE